ncbi:hypothetical protein RhiJN_01093 [Ceratobasidium sp. AG-Ba]|nr:hypothetical protein RhiJN_01093 [Ceratobasidium sp. AG-Ba]
MAHSIFPPHPTTRHFLPDFKSLIIQGEYPPSAPIHLCLSHISSGSPSHKPLLVSSSQMYLQSQLEEFNDAWLDEHACLGSTAENLHQIDIFYPPTHRHLRLLLGKLSTYSIPSVDADPETDHNTRLARAPTLLVLHELSRYFLSPQLSDDADVHELQLPTISTYMQLIIDAIAMLQFFSKSGKTPTPPRLVIFDKGLHDLTLPILRPVNLADIRKLPESHKIQATDALLRYIGWVGTVEKTYEDKNEEIASSQDDEIEIDLATQDPQKDGLGPKKTYFRMTLSKSRYANGRSSVDQEELVSEWYSYRDPYEPPFATRRRTATVLL